MQSRSFLLYTEEAKKLAREAFYVLGVRTVTISLILNSQSILLGCGKQLITAKLLVSIYIVVVIPLGIYFMFFTPVRMVGMWIATTAGSLICAVVQYVLIFRLDWKAESDFCSKQNESRHDHTQTTTRRDYII